MKTKLPLKLERELVDAAIAFREVQPWLDVQNAHYLLIGEAGGGRRVMSILGNGGQQFGLQTYSAASGPQMLVLVEEMSRMPEMSPTVMLELLEGETLELVSKKETEVADRARCERVGYAPVARVKQAWPVFRQFRPFHFPWQIDEAGAERMIVDLKRALRWATLVPSLAWDDLHKSAVVRRLPVVAETTPVDRPWTEKDITWEALQLPPAPHPDPLPVDAAVLAAWKALPIKPGAGVWLDERAQPMPIGDPKKEAQYFPRLGACFDLATGVVTPPAMGPAAQPYGIFAQEALGQLITQQKARPQRVVVGSEFMKTALAPWVEGAGMTLVVGKAPDFAEEFWGMIENFG
ncbi:MAG: hypothetical protein H2172_15240 [Opitutus sp.]|nr:hypothetical protein [Opitutus sp.]MCS6247820.1 hypothetical protein [Opitutus sp.]MCS6275151.1 hypothetical protein [Opitutus sp.]MCS6276279.1 hypothetical protein [Opitutus sp.]MCS6301373.1 hypothetical protein [Opitutus sp.]